MSETGKFKILVVDDEAGLREALTSYLEGEGYDVESAADGMTAMQLLRQESFNLVLTDIGMPGVSGIELLEYVKASDGDIDVIMITGQLDISYAISSMRMGAYDFFTKPFNFDKILLTLERVREKQALRADADRYVILKRERELQGETTLSLARAAEGRDRMNIGHGKRVAAYAVKLGEKLCYTDEKLVRLRYAGLLHDIGKIGIDDAILNKPGKLTEQEYAQMKRHSEIGEYILKPVSLYSEVAPIVRAHHERYDGSGYPDGIEGEDIPVDARIVCLVDYFDAITSIRPYRQPAPLEEALEMLSEEKGRTLDPMLVDLFTEIQMEAGAAAGIAR